MFIFIAPSIKNKWRYFIWEHSECNDFHHDQMFYSHLITIISKLKKIKLLGQWQFHLWVPVNMTVNVWM